MRLPMRLSKLKLNLRMKLPKLDLRTRLPKLKLDLSHENFFKLTMVFWILQFLLVGYLFATSGWLGKVGTILIGWALFEANRRTFFKKIELKEKEYKEGLVINVWTGKTTKIVPPEKMFFIFPWAEKLVPIDVTLQQAKKEQISGNPEGVEVQTNIVVPFQPDTERIMKYFQAGDVSGLIIATAQEVYKNIASELNLKDALTESSLISGLLETHLTKGPLRVIFGKINALWKLIKKSETLWEREVRIEKKGEKKLFKETPEGRNFRTQAKQRIPAFWSEISEFIGVIGKNLVGEKTAEVASEELHREIADLLNRIYEMGIEIETAEKRFELLTTEEVLKREEEIREELREKEKKIERVLSPIAEFTEEGWKLSGRLKPQIKEELEKSPLEDLLATKISSPRLGTTEPTADEIKNAIRSLTSAGFRKQMLDEYARQKNITIQKFIEAMRKLEVEPDKRLTPKDILDALLIDAGRLRKTQFEIPGLIEIGKAVANALKSKEVK